MTEQVHVGIDCGDLEIRAAYLDGGRARRLPLPHEVRGAAVCFDPEGNTLNLGVGFPSVLRLLGRGCSLAMKEREQSPESLVTRKLALVRQALTEVTGQPPGVASLAVPAALPPAERQALLGCARAAGFGPVALVDRCTAAGLGHHANGERALTAVVFDLGYGDGEYALGRLSRGRSRRLAAGSLPGLSGELLDAVVIEAIVLALRRRRLYLGLKHLTPKQWLDLHTVAETAREALSERAAVEVAVLPQLTEGGQPLRLKLRADRFAERVGPLITQATDAVQAMLEQTHVELSDLDTFLVVGDTAQDPPVWGMLHRAFAGRPERADRDLLALGAAYHAGQLSQESAALESGDGDDSAVLKGQPAPRWQLSTEAGSDFEVAEVIDAEPPAPAAEPTPAASVAAARQLFEEGRRREAEAMLEEVEREVAALRQEMQRRQEQAEALSGPRLLVQQARTLVNIGQFNRALDMAHEAFTQAPGDADVFQGMMQVHAAVSLAMDRPEQYETSIKVLRCALNHDPTDRSIHKALAERHLAQARAVRDRAPADALKAVYSALAFEPRHRAANQLLQELTAASATDAPAPEQG